MSLGERPVREQRGEQSTRRLCGGGAAIGRPSGWYEAAARGDAGRERLQLAARHAPIAGWNTREAEAKRSDLVREAQVLSKVLPAPGLSAGRSGRAVRPSRTGGARGIRSTEKRTQGGARGQRRHCRCLHYSQQELPGRGARTEPLEPPGSRRATPSNELRRPWCELRRISSPVQFASGAGSGVQPRGSDGSGSGDRPTVMARRAQAGVGG